MTTHQFGVRQHILPLIKSGRKVLEIRVADDKRKRVRKSDFITFNHNVTKRVIGIREYPSFAAMLVKEDVERIMPEWSKEQVLKELCEFYTKEKENLGVVVFELQVDE